MSAHSLFYESGVSIMCYYCRQVAEKLPEILDFDEIDLVADEFESYAGKHIHSLNNHEDGDDDQQIWNQFYNETSFLDEDRNTDLEANSRRNSSGSPKQSISSQPSSNADSTHQNLHSLSSFNLISKSDFFNGLKKLEKKKVWAEKAARR